MDLQPYSDNRIASVLVQLEKETVSGWFVVDNAVYTANTFDDPVKISEDGVDFGATNTFLGNAPTGSGTMHWTLIDGQVTARLTGSLYINNSSGVCSRMNLRYLTSGGTFLTSRSGGEVCADDNGLHQFTVDLDPYTSNKVGKVDVQLQTQGSNGSWNTAGRRRSRSPSSSDRDRGPAGCGVADREQHRHDVEPSAPLARWGVPRALFEIARSTPFELAGVTSAAEQAGLITQKMGVAERV